MTRGRPESDVKWLIAREIPLLRRYARALTRDPVAADDLVQDCLERALRKRHLWTRRGSLRGWLLRILYRVYFNDCRRRGGLAPVVQLELVEDRIGRPPGQEDRVTVHDIDRALDYLPVEQRAAILLVALEDTSYDEAADILDIPVGTLRSRLSRGRAELRRFWRSQAEAAPLRRVK